MNFCMALGTLASNAADRFYRLVNCFFHFFYCIQADSCPESFYVLGLVIQIKCGGGGGEVWIEELSPLSGRLETTVTQLTSRQCRLAESASK